MFSRRIGPLAITAALTLIAGGVTPVRSAAAASGGEPQVTVREERGVYSVAARFTIPYPPAAAVAVLTDYEQIPRFMPDVRTSQVLDRSDNRAVVEQEAVAKWMMFSRRVHLVLHVRESPTVIQFRDVCGRSFSQYEGRWQIVEDGDGASITYELVAKPSFDVPGFLLRRLLERDATEMVGRLQAEIAARSAHVPAGDASAIAR